MFIGNSETPPFVGNMGTPGVGHMDLFGVIPTGPVRGVTPMPGAVGDIE
jgi:hypothetical protein